jgi:hypothetical protein
MKIKLSINPDAIPNLLLLVQRGDSFLKELLSTDVQKLVFQGQSVR